MLPTLQLITQGKTPSEHQVLAINAIKNGCKWVQLRMKTDEKLIIASVAKAIAQVANKNEVLFTLNDHVDIAKDLGLKGVHLGISDMKLSVARKMLGQNCLIGATCNTINEIKNRSVHSDYIGLGPFRVTSTKKNLSPVLGLKGYNNALEFCKKEKIEIPVFAIGGIRLSDLIKLKETGVFGIAASGLLCDLKEQKKRINQIQAIFA